MEKFYSYSNGECLVTIVTDLTKEFLNHDLHSPRYLPEDKVVACPVATDWIIGTFIVNKKDLTPITLEELPLYITKKYKSKELIKLFEGGKRV